MKTGSRTDRRHVVRALVSLAGLALAGASASADRRRRGREDDDDKRADHDAAARARAAGEIRPLTEIIDHVKLTHPGEIVGIELDREHGRWVYEIKLIAPGGRFLEIYVDARDKTTVKIEGK